jgi:Flp pilus assembly protein TadG
MLRTALRKFAKDKDASATIEFVVTMPLFLAALAFSFEFGQLFLAHQATVNNVRSAVRYLSRSDLSTADIAVAENIVRTGQLAGGTQAEYLTTANATVSIDDAYTTFSTPTFSRSGKTFRIVTRVDFPLTIFGFIDGGGTASIPFVVVEDMRFVGI